MLMHRNELIDSVATQDHVQEEVTPLHTGNGFIVAVGRVAAATCLEKKNGIRQSMCNDAWDRTLFA
jgi:hypothetical protein